MSWEFGRTAIEHLKHFAAGRSFRRLCRVDVMLPGLTEIVEGMQKIAWSTKVNPDKVSTPDPMQQGESSYPA